MPLTAEEQFRTRARRALEAGEPFSARGEKNKAMLEEVREEVKRARKEVQAAAHAGQEAVRRQTRKGKGEIQAATAQAKRDIEEKGDAVVENVAKRLRGLTVADSSVGRAFRPFEALAALEAPAASSAVTTLARCAAPTALALCSAPPSESENEEEPDEPPSDPEDLAVWEAEKEREREWERARPAREEAARALRAEEQARRAAEKLAVMRGLPAPPEQMPEWFQSNVQRYYGQTRFIEHLRAEQRPLRAAAEEQLMQKRRRCRECRENGFKPREFFREYCCDEHWCAEEPDSQELASIEERLREEFAGEAAKAALEMKQAADEEAAREAARQAREAAEEAAREEGGKRAVRLLAPECLKCEDCLAEGFDAWAPLLDSLSARDCMQFICDRHAKDCERFQAPPQPERCVVKPVVRSSGPLRLL